MNDLPDVHENVVPIDRNAWKKRERSLSELAREERVVTKGGARMVKFNVTMPFEQFQKLVARFQGTTPSDKINTITRIANTRIDQLEREQLERQLNGAPAEPMRPA